MPEPAISNIISVGSGTIPSGRKSAWVNDSAVASGSIVSVVLTQSNSEAAGAGGLKYIKFTTGSPSDGNSFQVVLNSPSDKVIPFNYLIVSGTDLYN